MSADLSAVGAGATGRPALGASLRGKDQKTGGEVEVVFRINPEQITVSHMTKTENIGADSESDQIRNLGLVEIGISKVIVFGEGTRRDCDTLISWSRPAPVSGMPTRSVLSAPQAGKQQMRAQAVELEFNWADGLSYQVRLRSVTVAYVRFTGTGKPIRAEVRLNMYTDLDKLLPGTNPTSGGLAGRRSHVLDSSECLPSLAAANYGRPGAWRRIALANAIDDPLRVRPGTAVYLPGPGDPAGRAGRLP